MKRVVVGEEGRKSVLQNLQSVEETMCHAVRALPQRRESGLCALRNERASVCESIGGDGHRQQVQEEHEDLMSHQSQNGTWSPSGVLREATKSTAVQSSARDARDRGQGVEHVGGRDGQHEPSPDVLRTGTRVTGATTAAAPARITAALPTVCTMKKQVCERVSVRALSEQESKNGWYASIAKRSIVLLRCCERAT